MTLMRKEALNNKINTVEERKDTLMRKNELNNGINAIVERKDEIMQKYSSKNTSINKTKLPAIYKKISWYDLKGLTVLDYGAGKYTEHIKEFLNKKGLNYIPYDPYNIREEENIKALATKADVVICSNVLNVIYEDEIVRDIHKYIVDKKVPYFISVYEGDRSGVGTPTTKGYQRNEKIGVYKTCPSEIVVNKTITDSKYRVFVNKKGGRKMVNMTLNSVAKDVVKENTMKKLEVTEVAVEDCTQWSSVATLLVKEAGKCEAYASDIWYHLNTLHKVIDTFNEEGVVGERAEILVGFRDTGVDSNSFVRLYLGEDLTEEEITSVYRKLYKVIVEKVTDWGYNTVRVTLAELINK